MDKHTSKKVLFLRRNIEKTEREWASYHLVAGNSNLYQGGCLVGAKKSKVDS